MRRMRARSAVLRVLCVLFPENAGFDTMKLEELRRLLAETKTSNDGETVSNVRVDLAAGESVGRATLNRRKGEIWEAIGVDVVISDDPNVEALQYARKCSCGHMRNVQRGPNSSVHVILPCELCEESNRLCACGHAAGFHLGYVDECCHVRPGREPCSCEHFTAQE